MILQMDTTCNQDDLANNPAFEAVVQRTVNALLPNLLAQIREELRQEMANATNGSCGSGGGNSPDTIQTWLKRFNKKNPRSFSTVTSLDDAEHWIAHMEKIFEVLGCSDIYKVRLATYQIEGDALSWWKVYKDSKVGNGWVATLSWSDFREIFFFQYFPLFEKEKFEREFHNISMYDRETNTEFMKRFVRLARCWGERLVLHRNMLRNSSGHLERTFWMEL